jgi:hypothetical protein
MGPCLGGLCGNCGHYAACAGAGAQFDGSYVGQDTLLSGVAFLCGAVDLPERIEVQNGQFASPLRGLIDNVNVAIMRGFKSHHSWSDFRSAADKPAFAPDGRSRISNLGRDHVHSRF